VRWLLALLWLGIALWAQPAWADPIDVNAASADQLQTLPGIGPSKAAAIVEYRSANGAFAKLDDLLAVRGIGPATLDNLRDLVVVGPRLVVTPDAAPGVAPPAAKGRVDINAATSTALQVLPGIGPEQAAAIVADRQQNGPFKTCDDLARVAGIGAATVAVLRDLCRVN
jgi:competence protein ComEA